MKKVNIFVDYRTELVVEGSKKDEVIEAQGGLFGNRSDDLNGIKDKKVKDFPSIAEVYSFPISSVQDHNGDANNNTNKTEQVTINKSIIQAVKRNNEYKSKLELISTGLEEGREVVVFDEETVSEGSKK
nr:hypothetical protein [Tanacetum cinerariifolium]